MQVSALTGELYRQVKFYKLWQKYLKKPAPRTWFITVKQFRRAWNYYIVHGLRLISYCSAGYELPIYGYLSSLITSKTERRRLYWKKNRHELRVQTRFVGLSKACKHTDAWRVKQLTRLVKIMELVEPDTTIWQLQNTDMLMISRLLLLTPNTAAFKYQRLLSTCLKRRAGVAKTRLKRLYSKS